MRLATWNIRAGGGKRTTRIAQVLLEEAPDIVILTEYRTAPGLALLSALESLSYEVSAGAPVGSQNCVCVLSRFPLEPIVFEPAPKSVHRWVAVSVPALDLTVLGVHVPNQDEVWNKREFWDCVEAFATTYVGERAVIVGDLNTALDEDCEGDPIREAVYFKRLLGMGWMDAWRVCNSEAREFSWYSHRQNGFRIDHCLIAPSIADRLVGARMRHDVRTGKLSDHSMLTVEFGQT